MAFICPINQSISSAKIAASLYRIDTDLCVVISYLLALSCSPAPTLHQAGSPSYDSPRKPLELFS
ncbi:hypothetical protein F7725_000220 [Dissostichus mawsoni]|uniref:Uncharacterized protein n=1 Tax=Dissostichus mawsoni TaxID=36200 RepID=A0A7J5ZDR9_DISMA|nr:hypothetical protein F7725_000220 [Dissostichus mawsoni]